MEKNDLHGVLRGYLDELDWTRGATKADLLEYLAGRDEPLRTMVNEYVAEGSYQSADRVMNVIPEEAWQSVQGDIWRGSQSQFVEDVPSHFRDGQVGQDERDPQPAGDAARRYADTNGPAPRGAGGSDADHH